MAPECSQKRNQPFDNSAVSSTQRAAKRVKTSLARTILSQTSDKALNKHGDLDVSAFVQAREFEIEAMETSMGKSKASLAARAFQQVPKELRRRTASHNVKRVPKRLRARAAKEMREDNTPTVTARRRKSTPHMRLRLETAKKLEVLNARIKAKREKAKQQKLDDAAKRPSTGSRPPRRKKNTLIDPQKPDAKYRRRQIHKVWLPTHVFHAKRAHMPDPKDPLWRFAIPLTPTAKVYRPTHRAASSRGCIAWDTSYMSTILIEGVETSLLGLLEDVGVDGRMLTGTKGAKWRQGTRSWYGWVRERDSEKRWISEINIVWCSNIVKADEGTLTSRTQQKKEKRQAFLRVHPSAFLELWNELIKDTKIQRPSPSIEDLRFQMGSIEITGPSSTEALIGVLRSTSHDTSTAVCLPQSTWDCLSALSNPSTLPPNALLHFAAHDPRLFHPPRTVALPPNNEDALLDLLAAWPPDISPTPSCLFSSVVRHTASHLPSQKTINRRKSTALPGNFPEPLSTDPAIPVILLTCRAPSINQQGTWTLLLPWKCVLPVWYGLMHYPLRTGGNPRFGGLDELRQIHFERGQPWFPGDYPGTKAGYGWELRERAKRKKLWEKRPKSKRISWDAVNLGDGKKGEVGMGWACDWERLFLGPAPASDLSGEANGSKESRTGTENMSNASAAPEKESSFEDLQIQHLPLSILSTLPASDIPPRALSPINLKLLHRGAPTTCARIYRLPKANLALRKQWLSLLSTIQSSKITSINPSNNSHPDQKEKSKKPISQSVLLEDAPNWEKRQALARMLLSGPTTPQEKDYPPCPAEEDLLGFVTTGNFDLGAGKGTAVGSLALVKVLGKIEGNGDRDDKIAKIVAGQDDGYVDADSTRNGGKSVKHLKGEDKICIVRDAGLSIGRLARWEFI
ncbi:MAG: hypothetical protein Q9191_002655 [Dirinaria sp. TL-2023a]